MQLTALFTISFATLALAQNEVAAGQIKEINEAYSVVRPLTTLGCVSRASIVVQPELGDPQFNPKSPEEAYIRPDYVCSFWE
jgi:hypothetical protein